MAHELFEKAKKFLSDKINISGDELRSHFKIGYNSSGRLMDELKDAGIISKFIGATSRDVLKQLGE